MLFTPALLCLLYPLVGLDFSTLEEIFTGFYVVLGIAAVGCIFLGAWLARHCSSTSQKWWVGTLYGVCLLVVNGAIAFGGCLVVGTTVSH